MQRSEALAGGVPSGPGPAIRAALAEKPDGVLEAVAESCGATMEEVLAHLGPDQGLRIDGSRFEEIWSELTGWGPVMFIVHTRDGVFEVAGALPPGTPGRGYFNIHGDSPIGGHLKADRCSSIWLVDRPFFGRRSCSVQFVNRDGGVMFKVFVARGEDRTLQPEQLARFEALKARLTG
jgi:putative heme utilization carrier protein HutX